MNDIFCDAWYTGDRGVAEISCSIGVDRRDPFRPQYGCSFSRHILRPAEARLLVQKLQEALAKYEEAEGEREA